MLGITPRTLRGRPLEAKPFTAGDRDPAESPIGVETVHRIRDSRCWRCAMNPTRILLIFACFLALSGATLRNAVAADVPLAGRILLVHDTGEPEARRLRAASEPSPALAARSLPDPRVLGARVEIVAAGAAGGDSGVVALAPSGWTGLGEPSGSRGYRFVDTSGASGFRSIELRGSDRTGRLEVYGSGAALGFTLGAAQGDVLVRLGVGDSTFCLVFRADELWSNDARLVRGRRSAAPAHCGLPLCGNGTEDPGEDCDDGNLAARDGCSPTCLDEGDDPCRGITPESSEDLGLELVASGLFQPLWVVAPPQDFERLLVVEQNGLVQLVRNGVLQATPFLDLRGRISCCGERGLLSLVFHPGYAENRRFFVNYTDAQGATVVSRWRTSDDPDRTDADSEQVLFRIPQDFTNHNGGQLAFGPDGFLYVGMGDGGGAGDTRERAQDPASLLGKLLRVDVDVEAAPFHGVPTDNPNAAAGLPRGLIWASGLRNPWRFAFDDLTGDLFLSDVGQGEREEINVQPAGSDGGENYGWDVFEGSLCYDPQPHYPTCSAAPESFIEPVHEYSHQLGCSITGGFVYRGCRLPDLHGTYFYSDFCTPFVRTFEYAEGAAIRHRNRTADVLSAGTSLGSVTSFGLDARGEMYLTTFDGKVFRIVPEP
jgi:cysteine-rich repeat protein